MRSLLLTLLTLTTLTTLLTLPTPTHAVQPYITTAYSHTLAEKIKEGSLATLHDVFTATPLPDIAGKASAFVGDIDYALRSLLLQSVTLSAVDLQFVAPNTLRVTSSDLAAAASFHWSYKEAAWPHVGDGGSGSAYLSSTAIALSITLEKDPTTGLPSIAVSTPDVTVGKLDVRLSGGASWLYSFVLNVFKSKVVSHLQSALQSALHDAFQEQAKALLASTPHLLSVGDVAGIPVGLVDLSLVADPVIDPAFIRIAHLGRIADPNPPHALHQPTVPVAPLPDLTSGKDVQIALSMGVLNSDFQYLYDSHGLDMTFTSLPASSPIQLVVSNIKEMIPPLGKYFKDDQAITVDLSLDHAPNVTARGDLGTIALDVHASLTFSILPQGAKPDSGAASVYAFTLGALFSTSASFGLTKAGDSGATLLTGSVKGLDVDLALRRSAIGAFDPTVASQFSNFALHRILVPSLNSYLSTGYPLPLSPGLSLTAPQLSIVDGAILIQSGVDLSPQFLAHLLDGE